LSGIRKTTNLIQNIVDVKVTRVPFSKGVQFLLQITIQIILNCKTKQHIQHIVTANNTERGGRHVIVLTIIFKRRMQTNRSS
jgi:serine protease inhibitor